MIQTIQSEKNGALRVKTTRAGVEVWAGGYDQTSSYTNAMWKMALLHIPRERRVKHILLLGLGGGGVVPELFKKFPRSRLVAVEWDPAMIVLAKKNISQHFWPQIDIRTGDAKTQVALLERSFDCIIIDLFCGKKVSPVAEEPSFAAFLQSRLLPGGTLLANFFEEPSIASAYRDFFSLEKILSYQYNRLFVFRPFGAGVVGSPLPTGYLPYRMCRSYMEREAENQRNTIIIGSDDCPGYRTRYGSSTIDKFFGDALPRIEEGKRLIVWRPFTRTDHPTGWLQSDLIGNIGLTGIAPVTREYWKSWSGHAQRHRTKWTHENEWALRELSLEEFLSAYSKTKKEFSLKKLFSLMLARKVRGHGDRVRLIGASRAGEREVFAGFASLTIPESRQAVHLISFIHAPARGSSVGVGMMDDWFSFGQKNGLRFLDFGLFWKKGEPKSWKPWSNFKSQFGIHFIMHPSPFAKIMWK